MSNAVLYGDVSPNIIDGSSIWLVSASEVLSRLFDEVHLLLKAPLANDRLIRSVSSISNIVVHEPSNATVEQPLSARDAAMETAKLVRAHGSSAVVVRGMEACNAFCQVGGVAQILWSYVTDLPFPPERLSRNNLNRLNRIATNSHRMLSQTEASRSYLEAICPSATGKTVLMRPMIPDVEPVLRDLENLGSEENPLRIVYSGKFAKPWRTLEMLELPSALNRLGVKSTLTVIGDKYNRAADDPGWVSRMRTALETAQDTVGVGVQWLGALNRDSSIEQIGKADIGIGWRTRELDSSLEISTKALEYSICGTVPIINHTADHESLFGAEYPFFVDASTSVGELAELIKENLDSISSYRNRISAIASKYTMVNASDYLETVFRRGGALRESGRMSRGVKRPRTRLVVASHDMKFMGELMDFLANDPEFEVRQDHWDTLHTHDVENSRELAKWADVVFCEWAGPALKWYSEHKTAGSKLFSRLHRFEMNGAWMREIDWDKVDGMVFVSDFIRDEVTEKFDIPIEKTNIIPNGIDTADFDRDKLRNAQFHLGLVGYVPFLKRPDRALDLLRVLHQEDPRYVLHLKGRMPWDYSYEWAKPLQKQAYLELFARIAEEPALKEKVIFEPFSADIASWHRGIGFTLSSSSMESFHLAPAEGMAAGTIPIVWPRKGAQSIFGHHVFNNLEEAGERILSLRDSTLFQLEGQRAKAEAQQWDFYKLSEKWRALLSSPA